METKTFDSLFTSGQLQMCKILFPLLPPELRGRFAILIKLQELFNAMNYVKIHPFTGFSSLQLPENEEDLMNTLLPYCNDDQKEKLQQFREAFQQMGQLREMMEMMSTMKELFPEGMDLQNMDIFKNVQGNMGEAFYGKMDDG